MLDWSEYGKFLVACGHSSMCAATYLTPSVAEDFSAPPGGRRRCGRCHTGACVRLHPPSMCQPSHSRLLAYYPPHGDHYPQRGISA